MYAFTRIFSIDRVQTDKTGYVINWESVMVKYFRSHWQLQAIDEKMFANTHNYNYNYVRDYSHLVY